MENKTEANSEQEKVVFDKSSDNAPEAPAATNANVIPEEYLTDEDLYPATSSDSGGAMGTAKKKMPIIILVFLALVILIGAVFFMAGSLNKKPAAPGEVKLTFWGLWQSEQVMSELIKDYQKTNPHVEVSYILMDAKDNYRERVLERTRNGTGPDIFRFHNSWVPVIKELFVPAPETVFTAEDYEKTYYPVITSDLVLENKVIAVPYHLDGLVLIYNQSLLKNAGINKPPTDWESLINDSKTITVRDSEGEIVTAGIALGAAENISHFSDILGLMFLQNNVDLKKLEDDPNAETVLETYTNFVLSAEPVWSQAFDNSINAFAEEKVAMIIAPVWEIEVIKHLNPDLELKVTSVPQIRGGTKKNLANYWADGVSRGCKNQEQAWDFLKFLAEKEQQSRLFELEVKNGRMFGNVYPRQDMAELLVDNEYLSPLVKDAGILDSMPIVSRTYDNGLNDEIAESYLKDSVNSILLGTSVGEALGNFSLGVNQVFEKYKL
jgi:multiple sugar transport system substrate-binding protein